MSKYDDLLVEIDLLVRNTAKEFVPKLYSALKEEGYTPEDARARIEKDTFRIWSKHTVADHLPNEAKQTSMARPANKNAKQIIDTAGDPVEDVPMVEIPKAELDDLRGKLTEYSNQDVGKVQELKIPLRQLADLIAKCEAAITSKEDVYVKHMGGSFLGVRRN